MKTRTSLVTAAAVLLAAGVAHAGTLFSPAIFGSHDQNQATCVVLNAGTTTQSVTIKILNESGITEAQTTQTLAPGDFRSLTRNIANGVAYACSVTGPTSGALRASLSIIDIVPDGFGGSNHRPIRSAPLR
jgi:hypothetical protein